jgi:hypothetical protein
MNTKPNKRVALRSLVRPVSVLTICCSFAIALAASSPTASASRPHPRAALSSLTGAWSGTYGGTYHGTFTVQWTQSGSKLSGTIKLSTGPRGKLPLNGTVRGNTIRFGTVGSAAVTYSGLVSGKSMSGKYQTGGGGGSWSAQKTS